MLQLTKFYHNNTLRSLAGVEDVQLVFFVDEIDVQTFIEMNEWNKKLHYMLPFFYHKRKSKPMKILILRFRYYIL